MTQSNITKLADFVKNEYAKLTNYVRSNISEAADRSSEDIVQDVMTSIFENADISRPIENVAAYIYSSLKNRVIDILRKKNFQTTSMDEENDSISLLDIVGDLKNMPEKLYERNQIYGKLYEAVDRLPDNLKSVLIMNEIEGITFREISENTGIPAGTLMARKARAIEILKIDLIKFKNYIEE
jgi:RNA polymerase sigma factor (sigma-70 family)